MKEKTTATILQLVSIQRGGMLKRYSHQIWKDDHILELAGEPDQIQRILINAHFVCQRRCIVTTQPSPAIRVDAYSKKPNPCRQPRTTGNV